MKFVQLEQGTDEWLKWRRGLLTASDAAAIMGCSPYSTALQCWKRKLGFIPEQERTAAMQRGIDDEPIARALFNEMMCLDMQPAVIENSDLAFLGASLDGICKDPLYPGSYLGLEIKSQRIPDSIPSFHYAQMQHQMLASNGLIEKIYYMSYWQGNIKIEVCMADSEFMTDYVEKAREFWRKIVMVEEPDYTDADYKDMENCFEWMTAAGEYMDACEAIKKLEEKKKHYREWLEDLAKGSSCKGHRIKLRYKTTKGRIDYEAIPQLDGVDLEQYRKPASKSFSITLD